MLLNFATCIEFVWLYKTLNYLKYLDIFRVLYSLKERERDFLRYLKNSNKRIWKMKGKVIYIQNSRFKKSIVWFAFVYLKTSIDIQDVL